MSRRRGASGSRLLGIAACVLAFPAGQAQESARPTIVALDGFDWRRGAAARAVLPPGLREVSGLAVTGDGRVFGHGDEAGVVARIAPRTGAVDKRFALGRPPLRGDFEGIAIAGERFFLVTSDGRLFETREGADGASMPFTVTDTGFGKLCEIEGLAWEPTDRVLLLGCKNHLSRGRQHALTLFRWSVDHRRPAFPDRLTVDLKGLAATTGPANVKVSSVEREPRTGHLVVVAGPEWQLVELTKEGLAVGARALSRRLHQQPEGLAFLGDSLLLIADEAGRGSATLTRYTRAR